MKSASAPYRQSELLVPSALQVKAFASQFEGAQQGGSGLRALPPAMVVMTGCASPPVSPVDLGAGD